MVEVVLALSAAAQAALWQHLLPDADKREQLAFLFLRETAPSRLTCVDWRGVDPSGFAVQLEYHLELGDEARGEMIRHAHVLGCALGEAHSHPFAARAAFSPSDIFGLRDFVPHVRWRLGGQPYVALVVAPESFDGLVWRAADGRPEHLARLDVDGRDLVPTGDSIELWRADDER